MKMMHTWHDVSSSHSNDNDCTSSITMMIFLIFLMMYNHALVQAHLSDICCLAGSRLTNCTSLLSSQTHRLQKHN